MRVRWMVMLLVAAVGVTGCGSGARTASPTPTPEQTWEFKLAAIHGDFDAEAEFGRILDRIQRGTGICEAVPDRERASDVIVASWQQAGEPDTLLDWARTLSAACGG